MKLHATSLGHVASSKPAQKSTSIIFARHARPACFAQKDWDNWRAPIGGVQLRRPSSFCEDCTPEYQAQMLAVKRCEHPETIFSRDADGFISGRRPPPQEPTP